MRRPFLALFTLASCQFGQVGAPGAAMDVGGDEPSRDVCAGAAPAVPPTVIRALNRREYGNTVRDLLGVSAAIADALPADPIVGFDNHASALVSSSALVEQHLAAAEALSEGVDLTALVTCDPSPDERACAAETLRSFGRRAYRRPIEAEEETLLLSVYDEAIVRGLAFDEALRLVLQVVLQSPQFLYRVETTATREGGLARVAPYELASRLSYFLWSSMPDDALLDAAASGGLETPEQIAAEARRMLDDRRAHDSVSAFHRSWLQLYRFDETTKDPELFPHFAAAMPAMRDEAEQFVERIFWEEGLLESYLIAEAGGERFGLLAQAAILAQFANPNRTSPTRRGKFVREQILCQTLSAPPDDVPPLPNVISGETVRERLADHVANATCAACHRLTDPVGFGLEGYDAAGDVRSEEAGRPVDTSGELVDVTGGDGPFAGARELSERLIASEELGSCVATQWFRYALGRNEALEDRCSLERVQKEFDAAGHDLHGLLVAVTTSDAFLHVQTEVLP